MVLFIEHTLNTYYVPDPEEACGSPPDTKSRSTAKGGNMLLLLLLLLSRFSRVQLCATP